MKWNSALLILVIVLFAASCPSRLTNAQNPPRRVEIVAKRFEFSPAEITLKKGEPVTLVLTSKDVQHGLNLEAFHHVVIAKKGGSSEVEFTPPEEGTFVAQCASFCGSGHGSMKLTVHVTE